MPGVNGERVLVLMLTAADGTRMDRALSSAGLACVVCRNVEDLCHHFGQGAGVALLTEEAFETDRSGCLHRVLRDQPPWSDFPLIILAHDGVETRRPALREIMNATLVERPVRVRSLISVVRAALRSRRRQYEVRDHLSELARAEVALRASEKQYRTLFNKIDEGFCVIEVLFDGERPADYRFTEVNPAFEKHSGLRAAAGRTMRELAPDLDEHWFQAYGRVARTGEPERFSREAKALGRWFDVYAFPLGDKVAILFTDITARRRGEQERELLVQRLRESDRKKDDFIALLAHELRNPLAPIRNGLQVIRLSDERKERDRAQQIMDRQLVHMVRLIDDLLDVSRISRNKMELRRTRITLAEVMASAVETARPVIDEAGHELIVSLPPGPIVLDADLTRLSQVFGNLLTNSAKYTPRGGKIWISAERRDDAITVSVRDTGIGVPPESLGNIFDMFSQVDRSVERATGGLGIGLALVRGLVEMHGGTVTASSDGEGQGSTFAVTLPLIARTEREAPALSPRNGHVAGRRILVVDDNRDGAESLATMLTLTGNEVSMAHDGVEAIERAERFRPQIILMDIGMPRLNGLDAARQIREKEWGRAATIIALTGWGQQADRERSRAAGCDGHLIKPVGLPDLERLLDELTAAPPRSPAAAEQPGR